MITDYCLLITPIAFALLVYVALYLDWLIRPIRPISPIRPFRKNLKP